MKIISRVAMKDGIEVEPIEIRNDGVPIYPQGTVIVMKMEVKKTVTANRSCRPLKEIDMNKLIEPDTFENNYGWSKVAKEIQEFRDKEYLRKQRYWASEEGQMRATEMFASKFDINR